MFEVGDVVRRIDPKDFWKQNFGLLDLGPFEVIWVNNNGSKLRLKNKPYMWRSEYFVPETGDEKETSVPPRFDLSVWCK